MKILVLPSWYPPNGGRFFKLQSESLAKFGHTVDVLILEEKGITQKENLKIENVKSKLVNETRHLFYRIPKLNNLNISLFIKKYKKLLRRYLEKNLPDVIHVHSSIWAGVVVADLAKEFNTPYIITEHRSLFLKDKLPFKTSFVNDISNSLNLADNILVVSSAMENALKNYTTNSINVLPNMVDTDFFKPNNLKKNSDKIVFVSVGNLSKVKGFDILIQAFPKVVENNQQVKLKIIGQGEELNNLKTLSETLALNNFIDFEGYKTKDELLKIYQNAHVFVSASRVEPFGVVIIEALSCGLPIVVTNSGGPAELVNSKNGFLAENENVNSLQAKIQLMIDNLSNFDSSFIRENTISKYSEEVISKELEKYLDKCLQNKNQ